MRFGVMMTALVLLAAPAQAQGFLLVGEDPEGDGSHTILGAVSVGDVISDGRTDILGLELAEDDGDLTARLRIAEAPAGTGGYMYRALFDVGGETYWTCWTVQWVAGQESIENIKGCSRFTSGTQVGPSTTGDGVVIGDDGGQFIVQWAIPRSSIGGAGLADLENVRADTWFRGGSLSSAGSTTDSKYYWSRSDAGPDDGFWSIELPAAADLNVTLNGTADGLTLAPGTSGVLSFAVNATGAGNVSFHVEGAPDGWNATVTPANATAPTNTTVDVRVTVPTDAPQRVLEMTLVARAGNDTLASVPVVVTVVAAEDLDADAPAAPGSSGEAGNGTQGPDLKADADTPGPGALAALLVVGLAAVLRRRR